MFDQKTASSLSEFWYSNISHWVHKEQVWPDEYFKDDMNHLLVKKKSFMMSLHWKRLKASIVTAMMSSNLQAKKSTSYKNSSYKAMLERKADSHMNRYKSDVTEASERLC